MKKVYVEWDDAYTRDSWEAKKSLVKNARPSYNCKTIGWLIDRTKKHITICHTRNQICYMGALHIPIGCIKKIKVL